MSVKDVANQSSVIFETCCTAWLERHNFWSSYSYFRT